VILTGVRSAALKRTLAPVADKADALAGYAAMTKLVSEASFESPLLRQLQADLTRGDRPADKALASLRVLADLSQVRSSPMLHMILQWLGLWDFHVTHAVERWQRSHGRHLAAWLNGLGQVEGLAALAALAHGNPRWTFPDVDVDATAIEATGLGHPLLAEQGRVTNDVTVGPPATFLLVTGSNMSGKSTLLRAIGLNVVLAQAGAPVCAASFRSPPVALYTSMRIRDSLEKGVSYFMAEVLRLKQIVDATHSADGSRQIVMYLFDEMLQGTNANERTIAAQRILNFFASANAIGALATHDLRLLDSASVSRAAKLVHFREDVVQGPNGPALHFDYRLRPGPASSTNALRLMELAGLPVAES
jgi:DNA mismatch repair ATPase MutS